MYRAKAFFYVCAGVFLLALSYHLGARNAGAQAPGNPVVAMAEHGTALWAVTSAGDIYYAANPQDVPWSRGVNVFGGSPVPAQRETFGALKARYRGASKPATQDR